MSKTLYKNYFFYILYQVVTLLTPIIVVPYTTRVIGATGLGINAFTSTIAQWFVIFGVMGISMYGNKQIAKVRDDKEALSKTFMGIFIMQVLNMLLMIVLYALLILFAPLEYKNIYWIQMLVLFATMFDITWFFLGVEDFKLSSLRNVFFRLINVALIFLFVKSKNDLPYFVFFNGITAFLAQAILFVQLKQYIHFRWVSIKEAYLIHFKPNLILFVPQIAISIYSVLDQTMTGLLAINPDELAFYQQAIRFDKMFMTFITSIGLVMLPRIANEHAKGQKDTIKVYLNMTLKIALYLSIPMMFGMIGVGPYFIDWFLAKEFQSVGMLIGLISPIIVFISLSNVFGIQYMVPTDMLKEFSTSVVLGAIVNFILNLLLIPSYGAVGSAISVISAELTVTLSQYFFIRKRAVFDFNLRSIFSYFISGLAMVLVVILIGEQMGSRILTNLIQALVGALVYLGLLSLLKEEFHQLVLSKALGLIPWKK